MATPRKQLADLLRQARLAAGFSTQSALAKRMNVTRTVISKAESPTQPVPSDAMLAAWAEATGVPPEKFTELAQRAKSGTPEWFMPYQRAEAEAHTLRSWAPVVVPGLLQCESYARSILAIEFTGKRLDELVLARLGRQAVIGHAFITAIIDQQVVRRPVGSPAIMAEQCAYLASMAESRDIAFHVLPEGANMGTWGAFDLATRDGMTTVCITALEDVTSTTDRLVVKAMQAYEQILGAALPGAESLALLRMAEDQWKMQI